MSLTKIVGPSLGVVEVTSLSGNGTPLTSLNASSLLSGTVPVARLSSANSSVGGIVDIVAQTFAGAKTFTSNATFSGSRTFFASGSVLDWNSGDVTLTHSANTLTFAGAASGYIFNDGNVGIGVTPSDSDIRHLQFGTNAIISGSGNSYLSNNAVFKGAWKYVASSVATMQYSMTSSGHQFDYAAAGTAGGSITFTTALGINTSGHVGIGATARLYFDGVAGTGDTYILAPVDNRIDIVTGGSAHLFNTTGFAAAAYPTTASAANLYSPANGDYIYRSTSSIRFKHDIATLDGSDALSAVMAMRPVTYRGKTDADQRRYVGFVAEEMQQWAPLLCTYDDGGESGTPNYVTYDRVTAYLVAVVQRQQKEIDDLKLRLSKRDV